MDTRTKAIVQEIANQRDSALNLCANLRGEIAVLKERIAELTKVTPTKAEGSHD